MTIVNWTVNHQPLADVCHCSEDRCHHEVVEADIEDIVVTYDILIEDEIKAIVKLLEETA